MYVRTFTCVGGRVVGCAAEPVFFAKGAMGPASLAAECTVCGFVGEVL
jgi:hypothetical protein